MEWYYCYLLFRGSVFELLNRRKRPRNTNPPLWGGNARDPFLLSRLNRAIWNMPIGIISTSTLVASLFYLYLAHRRLESYRACKMIDIMLHTSLNEMPNAIIP